MVIKSLLTVRSLTQTAATGAACPLNCLMKTSLHKSHTMQLLSLEPLTTMLYVEEAAKQVTVSVWPYNGCLRTSDRRSRVFTIAHTLTTC